MSIAPTRAEKANFTGVYESLPRDVIAEVVVNHELKGSDEYSANIVRQYQDEAYIIEQCGFFGVGRRDETVGDAIVTRVVPTTSRRAFLIKRFGKPVLIDEVAYPELTAKGVGLSEFIARKGGGNTNGPLGILGYKDAMNEMEITNNFAKFGMRCGRVAAVIRLDKPKFMEWARRLQVEGIVYEKYDLTHMVSKLAEDDDPAIIVRYTAPRYADIMGFHWPLAVGVKRLERGPYSAKPILSCASSIYGRELETDEQILEFSRRYGIGQEEVVAMAESIRLLRRNPLSMGKDKARESIFSLMKLEAYLYGFNLAKYIEVAYEVYHATLPPPTYVYNLFGEQDSSFGAIANDFETAMGHRRPKNEETKEVFYARMITNIRNREFDLDEQAGLLRTLGETGSGFCETLGIPKLREDEWRKLRLYLDIGLENGL